MIGGKLGVGLILGAALSLGACDSGRDACGDDSDCAGSMRCDRNACVVCIGNDDCQAGEQCHEGRCVTCVDDDECASGQRCDWGDCVDVAPPEPWPVVCDPGARRCAAARIEQCNDAGSAWRVEATCSRAQACVDGSCRDLGCLPDALFCDGAELRRCSNDGTSSSLVEACEADQYCLENRESASCSATVCEPASPLCDGTRATHCLADGTGPTPSGRDCAEAGLVCTDGECRERICTPLEKRCQGNAVYVCNAEGTELVLNEACSDDEVCEVDQAACSVEPCVVGELSCSGQQVTRCNDPESGFEPTGEDCGTRLCVQGRCQTCNSNTRYCKDGDIYECDDLGLHEYMAQDCAQDQYCASTHDNYVGCQPQICKPNQPACSLNAVATCDALGAGFVGPYMDCGEDVCGDGQCAPGACPVGRHCRDGQWYYCDGTQETLAEACEPGWTCSLTPSPGPHATGCEPSVCLPGATGCVGNRSGICAVDGLSLVSIDDDCAASGKLCTQEGTCTASAIDVVGDGVTPADFGDGSMLNAVRVTSKRRLIELEARLVIHDGPRNLVWTIYEQSAASFERKLQKTVASPAGDGYFSSGTIDYSLEPNTQYLLGVVVSPGALSGYYSDAVPWAPQLSFGVVVGSVERQAAATFPTNRVRDQKVYEQRLTTEMAQ